MTIQEFEQFAAGCLLLSLSGVVVIITLSSAIYLAMKIYEDFFS